MIPALSRPSIGGAILPAAPSPKTAPASAAVSGQELVQAATPACNTLAQAQTARNCICGIRAEAWGSFSFRFLPKKMGLPPPGIGTWRHRGKQRGTGLCRGLLLLRNACEPAMHRDHLTTNPLTGRSRFADKFTIRHCREAAPTPAGLKQIGDWLDAHAHAHHAGLTKFQERTPDLRILMPRAGPSSGVSPFRKQLNSNSLAQHYLYLVGCLYWQPNPPPWEVLHWTRGLRGGNGR